MRAKMKCVSITNTQNGSSIKLEPVIAGSPENEEFFKWTPYGFCELGTINDEVIKQFKPGKEYYVDFSDASKENA